MTHETKARRVLTPEEQAHILKFGERVQTISQKIFDIIAAETEDLSGTERWMVMSRVVTGVFAHHFSISINTAGGEMEKRSAPKPPAETI